MKKEYAAIGRIGMVLFIEMGANTKRFPLVDVFPKSPEELLRGVKRLQQDIEYAFTAQAIASVIGHYFWYPTGKHTCRLPDDFLFHAAATHGTNGFLILQNQHTHTGTPVRRAFQRNNRGQHCQFAFLGR